VVNCTLCLRAKKLSHTNIPEKEKVMLTKFELGNQKVKDIWKLVVKKPTCISKDESLDKLLEFINNDTRTRHVYVTDGTKLIGSIRMNTVVRYLFPLEATIEEDTYRSFTNAVKFNANTVGEIMNTTPKYVYEDSPLSDVARILIQERINELPVVDSDMNVTGQVNVYEIIHAYLEQKNKAASERRR
jgi:CBS domain-containing protein